MTVEQRIRELGLTIAGEPDPRAIERDHSLEGAIVVAHAIDWPALRELEQERYRLIAAGRSHTIIAEPS